MEKEKIKVKETEEGTWECPDCGAENKEFLFRGEELPEILHCPICGHTSGKINWKY